MYLLFYKIPFSQFLLTTKVFHNFVDIAHQILHREVNLLSFIAQVCKYLAKAFYHLTERLFYLTYFLRGESRELFFSTFSLAGLIDVPHACLGNKSGPFNRWVIPQGLLEKGQALFYFFALKVFLLSELKQLFLLGQFKEFLMLGLWLGSPICLCLKLILRALWGCLGMLH